MRINYQCIHIYITKDIKVELPAFIESADLNKLPSLGATNQITLSKVIIRANLLYKGEKFVGVILVPRGFP